MEPWIRATLGPGRVCWVDMRAWPYQMDAAITKASGAMGQSDNRWPRQGIIRATQAATNIIRPLMA